jgi:cation transport ATPase
MYAASIESNSNHPISKAIVEESHKQNLDLFPVDNFLSISGL